MVQEVRLLETAGATTLIADAVVTFCLMDSETQKAVAIEGNARAVLQTMIEDGL